MKRALALLAVCSLFGFAGLAQTLTGSTSVYGWWDSTDGVGFFTDLYLSYTFNSWTISNYSIFDQDGFSYTQFGIKGELGPVSLAGTMRFLPNAEEPRYRTDLKMSVSIAGLDTGLWVFHQPGGLTLPPHRFGLRNVYCGDQWAIEVTPQSPSLAAMVYYTWVKAENFRADVFFTDDSTGIEFYALFTKFEDLSLCCGVTYDAEFMFYKETGFDRLKLTLKDISLCCDLSFDIRVIFDVDNGKTVEILPKYGPFEGCVGLYGGWNFTIDDVFDGYALHGFAVKCSLGDCSEIGILTAFAPQYFFVDNYALLGGNFPGMASGFTYRYYDALQPLPNWWYSYYTELFEEDEYEVFWFTMCGPGCCGGNWNLEVNVFFAHTGGLFDINRVRSFASIPIMENLEFEILMDAGVSGLNFIGGGLSLSF